MKTPSDSTTVSLEIPAASNRLFATIASAAQSFWQRPEMLFFLGALLLINGAPLFGTSAGAMIFQPQAVAAGQWWRVLTHPFVHVTWYHLLLDGAAFFVIYHSLLEKSLARRLTYVLAGMAGSFLIAWSAAPNISGDGLCGLSGIAHGLTAVSALEMMVLFPPNSPERKIGLISFILVVGKAAVEALSGHMFFTFLYFGMVGTPVAVSHAGGVLGALLAYLATNVAKPIKPPTGQTRAGWRIGSA